MTRAVFDEALMQLHYDLVKMAVFTEKAIGDAVIALETRDKALAEAVMKNDDVIDGMERQIEHKCIHIMATQQPIAKDLRLITAILKMITDLERIADQASDISEYTMQIIENSNLPFPDDMPKMADIGCRMVKDAINSYVYGDIELAKQVIAKDKEVNGYFDQCIKHLEEMLKAYPNDSNAIIQYVLIAKYLERIGDHSTNLAEWAMFNITGNHEK